MGRNGHKRKNNHVVIVTSDATDVRMRQFRIRPWILQVIIIFQCIVIGALIGFVLYEREAWEGQQQRTDTENGTITALEEENAELESQVAGLNAEIGGLNAEIDGLNEKVRILSETVTQKAQTESHPMIPLLQPPGGIVVKEDSAQYFAVRFHIQNPIPMHKGLIHALGQPVPGAEEDSALFVHHHIIQIGGVFMAPGRILMVLHCPQDLVHCHGILQKNGILEHEKGEDRDFRQKNKCQDK